MFWYLYQFVFGISICSLMLLVIHWCCWIFQLSRMGGPTTGYKNCKVPWLKYVVSAGWLYVHLLSSLASIQHYLKLDLFTWRQTSIYTFWRPARSQWKILQVQKNNFIVKKPIPITYDITMSTKLKFNMYIWCYHVNRTKVWSQNISFIHQSHLQMIIL